MAGQTYDGAAWRALRQERGLTQQDVAEALGRLARVHEQRGVGVNADMVSKWERGEKTPSAIYRRLLRLLFDTSPALASSRALVATAEPGASMAESVGQRLMTFDPLLRPALAEMWKDDLVKRRSMLQLMGALPMAGVDGVAQAMLERSDSEVAATAETVSRLGELADDYQRLYHDAEPTNLITAVRAFLRTARKLLAAPLDPELRTQLLSAYGQVGLLAGRVSFFDLHDASAARGYFAVVMDAARELGDHVLAAAALGHMSFVPAGERNFEAARDYVRRTRWYAQRGEVPMVASWASAIESEILTQANESNAAVDAVEQAGTDAEGAKAGYLPSWFDFYDRVRLEGFRGYALLQAGRPDEARVALESGVNGLPAHAVKQRAVLFADLATVHLHLSDLEQACRIAGFSLAELSHAGYATGADRVREFRAEVEPWRKHRAVRHLDEQLVGV